jgi:hypothetical protein
MDGVHAVHAAIGAIDVEFRLPEMTEVTPQTEYTTVATA